MKKKPTSNNVCLGDLIVTVSSYAKSESEALAALQDLFSRGRVQIKQGRQLKRIRFTLGLP